MIISLDGEKASDDNLIDNMNLNGEKPKAIQIQFMESLYYVACMLLLHSPFLLTIT